MSFIIANWWRIPFVPFRVIILCLAYYVFEPLTKICEWIGEKIPGITTDY